MQKFDELGKKIPVLVDLKPSGDFYMEHLYEDGGLMAILQELKPFLHLDCLTVSGKTLGQEIDAAPVKAVHQVVRSAKNPVYPVGGLAYLSGNLAPRGAVIKHASATKSLLQHRGRAVVFESLEDLTKRIDDPHLDVTANDVLVLKNAGPKGAPGMPEAGYLPIPKKLAQAGVKDMVRISDARMSGTAFGTIVLHITPEAADGGPLAIVQNGDWIVLDVEQRRIHLEVADEEIQMRLQQLPTSVVTVKSGYRKLYLQTVTQADLGCDFDFMMPELTRVAPIPIGD